jgi:signal transduction histidine kinase
LARRLTRSRGVGTRLLLAFFGISAFSALVAVAAIYAFFEVGQSLALIDRRIEPILASLEVSRSVERLVTASSALSAVTTEQDRLRVFAALSGESARLQQLLTELSEGGISQQQLGPIESHAVQLNANFIALDAGVRLRLQVIELIKHSMRSAFETHEEIQRLLAPTLLIYDSQISRLGAIAGKQQPEAANEAQELIAGLLAERPVQRVRQQVAEAVDSLAQASVADQKQRVLVLAFRLRRAIQEIEAGARNLAPKLRPLFLAEVDKLRTLVEGAGSIPQLRQKELDLIADAGRLLAENTELSAQLTAAAEQLVGTTKSEVRAATSSAAGVQRLSTLAIAVLVALSLVTSILIVWLYVGRNIVRRLNRLNGAMFEIAGGARDVAVPMIGRDEIAAMGQAVETFRRNAIERDQLLAERAEAADRLERTVEKRTVEMRQARDEAIAANRKTAAALSELKAAQASLIQAEKMASLGQLTAGIAHEIKNPLNFVNNFAFLSNELLTELKEIAEPAIGNLDEDKRSELDATVRMLSGNLSKIAEHGRRADNIVKSMLEHSRGTSGERRTTDLNVLVEEALNLAYHGARAQDQSFNVTLERDYDDTLTPIELVPQDMTRVLLNLFGNGFYAASKRARGNRETEFRPMLHVTTKDAGDAVEVRVRDNGTGIPPDIRDKLFQPFFTTKPTGEGTGLGLSISYDIVTQEHGGTITLDSEVGRFTEFIIRLPRRGQAPSARVSA